MNPVSQSPQIRFSAILGLVLGLSAFAVAALLSLLVGQSIETEYRAKAASAAQAAAEQRAQRMDDYLSQMYNGLETLASTSIPTRSVERRAWLGRVVEQRGEIAWLCITNPAGKIESASQRTLEGQTLDPPLSDAAVLIPQQTPPNVTIRLSAPLSGGGALLAAVDWERFQEATATASGTFEIFVVGEEGQPLPGAPATITDERRFISATARGDRDSFPGLDWSVVARLPLAEALAPAQQWRSQMLLASVLLGAVLGVGGTVAAARGRWLLAFKPWVVSRKEAEDLSLLTQWMRNAIDQLNAELANRDQRINELQQRLAASERIGAERGRELATFRERFVELSADNAQLEKLNRQKSRIVSDLAHDLGHGVTNLLTWVYLLERKPDSMEQNVAEIKAQAQQLKQLLSSTMRRAQLEAAMGHITLMRVDLNHLVGEVVKTYTPNAQAAGLELEFQAAAGPLLVMGDENQLTRAVTNLIVNAINYTPSGRVQVRASQGNGTPPQGCIAVEDTGIGIPAADLPRLFDRHFRGSNLDAKMQGSGLGLSIAHDIVERHSGRIVVHSTPNVGTTFEVFLPLLPIPAHE